MTINDTLFASNVINNELFTVDLATGTPTSMGTFNGTPLPDNITGLDFTGDGSTLYGVHYDTNGGGL